MKSLTINGKPISDWMKSIGPVWVIAGALAVIAGTMLLFAGWWFVWVPYQRELRRQEIIRQEPWRQ